MVSFSSSLTRTVAAALLVFACTSEGAWAQQVDAATVRVRLMRSFAPRTIVVSSNAPLTLYAGDPHNPIDVLAAREKLTLTTSNNQVYLRLRGGAIFARSLVLVQPEGAELALEIAEGRTIPSPRTYEGAFHVQVDPAVPSTLSIENDVNIEDYVAGVLASEFNYRDALEASKAVAVCIRTLAYRALLNQGGPGFALPDDEMWQVYAGTGPINETVLEAVLSTRGEVLRFGDELAEAVYFASSGGHTANNEDVWAGSQSIAYLRGKADPYDRNSPNHTWESSIPRERLLSVLSDQNGFRVTGIRPLDRSRDGRIRTMDLTGENQQKRISGNEFRLQVTQYFGRESLKSTFFEVNAQPDLYVFKGKGYGHGVGMNQWGALELARKGNLYGEILGYYYNGTQLDRAGTQDLFFVDGIRPSPLEYYATQAVPLVPAPPSSGSTIPIDDIFFGVNAAQNIDYRPATQYQAIPDSSGNPDRTSGHAPLNWNARAENGRAESAAEPNRQPRSRRIGW